VPAKGPRVRLVRGGSCLAADVSSAKQQTGCVPTSHKPPNPPHAMFNRGKGSHLTRPFDDEPANGDLSFLSDAVDTVDSLLFNYCARMCDQYRASEDQLATCA